MIGIRLVLSLAILLALSGCYSFRGGSTPAHLETIVIPEVIDNSGAGRPTIRFDVTNDLIERFRDDNSLRVIDGEADSRLEVTLTRIVTDIRQGVSADDRETLRSVVLEARVTFYDNVKERAIYEAKAFQGTSTYDLSAGDENEAIAEAIEQLDNAILLATVADW